MRKGIMVLAALLFAFHQADAQKSRDFSGKSRKDFFGGAEDYRDISKVGLQISFGPNYTLTRNRIDEYEGLDANTRPTTTFIDPMGRFGAFIDIGMAHYRLKSSRIVESWKIKRIGGNIFHRYDWGIGFNYIGGAEHTKIDFTDALGNFAYSTEEKSTFYNGYLTARITADRFTLLNDKWHLETGLGFNFNYNILPAEKESYLAGSGAPQKFQKDFMAQLHGHIGFNYKIRRGDYFIIGMYLPAIGIYEFNRLKPTIQWYSSNYWPVHLQFKWIHHFTKKSNGCNTGSDDDRKRNEEYMQNR